MHPLLENAPGQQRIYLGNEAIARGAIEAGLSVGATYPGTPSSEISLNFFQVSQESNLYFEYSTNEKVSMEVAAAAANTGLRSMCIMKHVGLNVAADTLMTLAYIGVKGGMVILTADDPAMFSSQNEQDNRYYGKLAGLCVLEPSDVAQAKEMIKYAFELSEILQKPVIFRTTTRINHSTMPVPLGEIIPPKTKGIFKKNPLEYLPVPVVARKLHARLLENLNQARTISESNFYNVETGSGDWGIICSGVSYGYAADAIKELGIKDKIRILRLGFSYPLPTQKIETFLKSSTKVLIIEEGEPILEEGVCTIAQKMGLTLPIQGKSPILFSQLYEFNPELVKEKIAAYFDIPYTSPQLLDLSNVPELPQRPPTLCPGCSHRAIFYAINQAIEGIETIHITDIGCYTLGYLPPLNMGDFLLCMGAATGAVGGFTVATDQKVISLIGDSTFFHSGISGLINAVFNQHKFTLVILDNGTTAMTGHQPHPGVDMKQLNLTGYGQVDIKTVVKSLGIDFVKTIRPFNIKKSIETLKEAFQYDGISVVVVEEECILYAKSLKKKRGRSFTVSNKCKNHRTCIQSLACPAFYIEEDRVKINAVLCTGCAVCAQICPENAIIPLKE